MAVFTLDNRWRFAKRRMAIAKQWRFASRSSFTSCIDSKGRALISAQIRRKLGLKYGSLIAVSVDSVKFNAKTDERGRFVVPAEIRKNTGSVSGLIEIGRSGERVRRMDFPKGNQPASITAGCGPAVPGSKAYSAFAKAGCAENPGCGPDADRRCRAMSFRKRWFDE